MTKFEKLLITKNLAKNTVNAYVHTIESFKKEKRRFEKASLLSWKAEMIETYKGKTVNQKIQAMNNYLDCVGKPELKLKAIKVQQKTYLENVISDADYSFLKKQLKKENNLQWYFIVRFLGATGARISELIKVKVEHVKNGYIDLYTKGGKIRRIYIPVALQKNFCRG